MLKTFVKQFTTREQTGSAIGTNMVMIVNDLVKDKLSKGKLESVESKHHKSENCKDLISPKINKNTVCGNNSGKKRETPILRFKKFNCRCCVGGL